MRVKLLEEIKKSDPEGVLSKNICNARASRFLSNQRTLFKDETAYLGIARSARVTR